jgi:hypothetical protein
MVRGFVATIMATSGHRREVLMYSKAERLGLEKGEL